MKSLKVLILCRPPLRDAIESYIPALWIKEMRHQISISAYCMSMDRESSKPLIERYFDYGVEEIYLISDKQFAGADTFATSYTLYQAICNMELDFDLILADAVSTYGETGHIPAQIAAFLNIPFAINVAGIVLAENNIICKQIFRSYEENISLSYPCLLSLNSNVDTEFINRNCLTLFDIMAKHHKEIKIMNSEQLKISEKQCGMCCSHTIVVNAIKMNGKNKHKLIEESRDAISELNKLIKGVG